jgi:hypothetical protein
LIARNYRQEIDRGRHRQVMAGEHLAGLAFAAVVDALTSICSELAKRYLLPFG